ncbi:MAG: DUF222 domain-containing protein [Propionibacteriaceae bacterium]
MSRQELKQKAGEVGRQEAIDRDRADVLAGRICVSAAEAAQSECQLLELIGEFDAGDAVRWWDGVKSVAHWLSWACSMSAGTAREHVRVARALRRMPTIREAFRSGRLSYSKIREVTRVVDVVDEAHLCGLALTATASQLSRMVAAFRAADGTRIAQEPKRQLRWQVREDGMVEVRVRLPAEEAAVLQCALAAAEDQFGEPPPAPGDAPTERPYSRVDALLDVAHSFVAAVPQDRSGEDRTLVVVQVAAEQLAPGADSEDVLAGTSDRRQPTCHVAGAGPVETATAQRLACDADVIGAVVDRYGEVLALGRTRRLVSRAQRRALMIRDGMCRYPGCHQTHHLKAHHVRPWAAGGPTDLDNLVLLCQWHHTAVHEGRMSMRRTPGSGAGWVVTHADGSPVLPWHLADALPHQLIDDLARRRRDRAAAQAEVRFDDGAARVIRPGWAGEQFDLRACVDVLFAMSGSQERRAA